MEPEPAVTAEPTAKQMESEHDHAHHHHDHEHSTAEVSLFLVMKNDKMLKMNLNEYEYV